MVYVRACEREVRLGCVHGLLFCVWLLYRFVIVATRANGVNAWMGL